MPGGRNEHCGDRRSAGWCENLQAAHPDGGRPCGAGAGRVSCFNRHHASRFAVTAESAGGKVPQHSGPHPEPETGAEIAFDA